MNIIKLLITDITTRNEIFNLPYYITKTLKGYEEAGDIELEKFVVSSVEGYINSNGKELQRGSIRELTLTSTMPIIIRVPKLLILRLWLLSLKLHVSMSAIVNESLGHSIPMLLDREEAQENYMHELAQ